MFAAAIAYVQNYFGKRAESLQNKARRRWFVTDAGDLKALTLTTFSADSENAEWLAGPEKGTDPLAMLALRVRIAVLSGMRHDLRSQFSVGADCNPKTACDFDRHGIGDARFTALKADSINRRTAAAVTGTAS